MAEAAVAQRSHPAKPSPLQLKLPQLSNQALVLLATLRPLRQPVAQAQPAPQLQLLTVGVTANGSGAVLHGHYRQVTAMLIALAPNQPREILTRHVK